MKKSLKLLSLCLGCTSLVGQAQTVDLTKYTDYSPLTQPDSSLLVYGSSGHGGEVMDVSLRPDHVNNMESKHFPPVFNQAGGSCGSASRIGYMFTHEMNAYRATDASFMENCYPTHFVWLLTSGNSGKGEFMKEVGIPSASTYGGRTYSELFGNQSDKDEAFGWMNGYDKWYSGMFNRMEKVGFIPANMGTPEGREALKNWLWNHNGDVDYAVGGIGGIGVATGTLTKIPKTPTNDEYGLTGLKCVDHWGDQVNHALTIVGYDDRVEFDLNKNGIYGEADADEKGAWIIVNSWGTKWGNGGVIYCPYAYGGKRFNLNEDGSYTFDPRNWWSVEILKVRKEYRPLRTIKVKMDYNRRSELRLSAGVTSDLSSMTPERIQLFHHFNYAGDGNRGNTNPAPLVPMLGRWADGKLHDEPMEFGYDLTDLTAGYDRCQPLKYFFIIETKLWGCGEGHIYDASLMDYEFDEKGIEYPFDMKGEQVQILSKGNRTVISVIVEGEGYHAPRNLSISNQRLSWECPKSTMYQVDSYNIYRNGEKLANVKADVNQYHIIAESVPTTYGVSAVYEGNKESKVESLNIPVAVSDKNTVLHLQRGGLVIPGVYDKKYEQSTIEFWVSPDSTHEEVFEAGPGWGDFFFMAGAKGSFTVGWENDKANKIMAGEQTLSPNHWTHIAMVVDGKRLVLYVNGKQVRAINSKRFTGVGGFGDLVFRSGKKGNAIQARFDEIRIWNFAKSAQEISKDVRVTYPGRVYPNGLMRYCQGNVIKEKYENKWFESVAGLHGELTGLDYAEETAEELQLQASEAPLYVHIQNSTEDIPVGTQVQIEAEYANSVTALYWNVPSLNIIGLQTTRPSLVFEKAGDYEVIVEASNAMGETISDTCMLHVGTLPQANADFHMSKEVVTLGERVSFHVDQPVDGYRYEWSMPGADVEHQVAAHASASYKNIGQHHVTLAVISPSGKQVTSTKTLGVELVAPMAEFTISSAVLVKGETTFLHDQSKYNPDTWKWLISSGKKNLIVNGQHSSLTMETPGVYDVSLTVANEKGKHTLTRNGALIVCNAESETGLNFAHAASQVVLSEVPLAARSSQFTIEWWMNPDRISTYCNGIGESERTFLLKNDGDGVLSLFLNSQESKSPRKYVIPYQWHHYAVSYESGRVKFYRDGLLQSTTNNVTQTVPAMDDFIIGVEHYNMSGMIDEFRIWENCLTESELQSYVNSPIIEVAEAEKNHGLKVYYDFNQGSGDVLDATSNANTGVRKGFGPDGDAWILSSGVFCLNFDEVVRKDVTAQFLKNAKTPFKHETDRFTNDAEPNRFYAITDWTLENTVTQNNKTSGVYVDSEKDYSFTCQTGWEGFANLVDHKVYQTVTLPAGDYELIANYGKWKSAVKNTVMAVALGKGLPNAKECEKKALASTVMVAKAQQMSNSAHFVLKEDTEVSMGLVLNMQGRQSFVLNDFQLACAEFESVPADGANGFTLLVGGNGYEAMCLPYAVLIPEGVVAYVAKDFVDGKVLLQKINDGVIPSSAGVVLAANPGGYHFVPTSKRGAATGVLVGNIKEFEVQKDLRYYVFDNQEEPCFRLWTEEVIPARQVFFTRSTEDQHDVFRLDELTLGVELLPERPIEKGDWYDIGGRKMKRLDKGIYVTKGSKILIR